MNAGAAGHPDAAPRGARGNYSMASSLTGAHAVRAAEAGGGQ